MAQGEEQDRNRNDSFTEDHHGAGRRFILRPWWELLRLICGTFDLCCIVPMIPRAESSGLCPEVVLYWTTSR